MLEHNFTIQTRQKSDELVRTDETLGPLGIFGSDVREVAGYSAVSVLAKSTQSIQVRIEEACTKDGTFGLTQTLASALDPTSGLYVVCERAIVCGAFAKFYVDNLNAVASADIDACAWGVPVGGGVGVGGSDSDVRAATFVVGPNHADYPMSEVGLNAAIAALPAEGGYIFIREGTIALTATVMISKHIAIIGAARGATIINTGSNAIRAFSVTADVSFSLERLTIQQADVAGQVGIYLNYDASYDYAVSITDVEIDQAETGILVEPGKYPLVRIYNFECFSGTGGGNVSTINGHGDFQLVNADIAYGFKNNPDIWAVHSYLHGNFTSHGFSVGRCRLDQCDVIDGVISPNADLVYISQCNFQMSAGTIARWIDIPVSVVTLSISGCRFLNYTSEAIRLASSGGIIEGNQLCEVTETGAADSNLYNDNTGFSVSTIIGASSVINGAKRVDASGTTADAYATIVPTQTNKKILFGEGTIKNTGGTNALRIKESLTDAFGVSSTAETDLAAGFFAPLSLAVPIATMRPPYTSYLLEVKSLVAASSTTYEMHFGMQGEEA